MLTLFFIVLLFVFIGKMIHLAFKFAWGISKIVLAIVSFPLILVGLAIAGFMWVSIIILIIAGIISLLTGLVTG